MNALPTLRHLAPALALALGLSTLAMAQPPGGGRGGPGGPGGPGFGPPPGRGGIGMLLRAPEVREELELLEDQQKQLEELEEQMRDRMRSEMGDMFRGGRRGGEEGGGRPDWEAMRGRMEEMRTEVEGRLAEILTTQQLDRLKQIDVQQQVDRGGARALMDGPLADKLGLTSEQKDQLREKAREVQTEMDEKMKAARAEAREKLLEVLTSEQREQLTTMMGDQFTLPEPPMGPPGFERGRGGRRGGPEGFGGREGRRGGPRGEGGDRGADAPPADAEPEL